MFPVKACQFHSVPLELSSMCENKKKKTLRPRLQGTLNPPGCIAHVILVILKVIKRSFSMLAYVSRPCLKSSERNAERSENVV